MKGLSREEDIHDYIVNRQSRRQMYDQIVDAEIDKFDAELTGMLEAITRTITELKQSIREQLE